MATATDTELRLVAETLLAELGGPVTFHYAASRSYSASTGNTTEGTVTDLVIKASPPAPLDARRTDSETVVFIAAKDAEDASMVPYLGMRLTQGSRTFSVVEIHEFWGGEQIALYGLEIER